MMKNKLKVSADDVKQYKHDSPPNSVLRIYRKYAVATAMEVVIPIKIISSFFWTSNAVFWGIRCSRRPRIETKP